MEQLLGQAAERGVEPATLRAIVEEAGELGAVRALQQLGLSDERAGRDVAELRELLGTWREAKRSAWRAALKWVAGWVAGAASVLLLAAMAGAGK